MGDQRAFPGRRVYDRFEANTTAEIHRGLSAAETVLLENVSARGVAVLGYRPFSAHDKLTVVFRLPLISKRTIHKQAHVAWSREINEGVWEAGLDFGMDNMLLLR